MKNYLLYIACSLMSIHITMAQQTQKTVQEYEKNYVHTDRSLYFPGETIWFKTYITDEYQGVTSLSDIAYARLVAPDGSIADKKVYAVENGFSYGDFYIEDNWVGGIYTLEFYTSWCKNFGENAIFKKKLTVQKVVTPNLLMDLDFKKKSYGPGANVSLTVQLKNLKEEALTNTNATYTVLIDGVKKQTTQIYSNDKGVLNIEFNLPASLSTNDVLINVKVPYKGSVEAISRNVPVTLDTIDLQLLPEGGVLLANYKNTVAFKAVNVYGKPADVKGIIKNSAGTTVASFESFHDGMGSFQFMPKSNEKYTAHITYPFISYRSYKLPKTQKEGLKIALKKQDKETIYLTVLSSHKDRARITLSDVKKELYCDNLRLVKGENQIAIPSKNFPKGITTVTLKNNNYISERLVFVNHHHQLDVQIELSKENYKPREKTEVTITTTYNGKPVASNLSVAVVDNALLSFADDKQDNIQSYLLLSSELKGTIHEPSFYMDPKEKKAQKAIDFLMLTHGWRSYLKKKAPSFTRATYPLERLAIESGVIKNKDGQAVKANLLLFQDDTNKILRFKTNENGVYRFKTAPHKKYTLIAYNEAGDPLTIHKNVAPVRKFTANDNFKSNSKNKSVTTKNILRKKNVKVKAGEKAKGSINLSLEKDNSTLNEVVITGMGISKEKKALGYTVATISAKSIANEANLSNLLMGKAAGVQVTAANGVTGSNQKVSIRGVSSLQGTSEFLYIIDGVPMERGLLGSENNLNLDPSNIQSITIIKGLAATTLYGSSGQNGVISISLHKPLWNSRNRHQITNPKRYLNYAVAYINSYSGPAFSFQKKFYTPIYENIESDREKTDFRTTVYWNPIIQTNAKGKATFSFYNNESNSSFKITAAGVGYNGLIGSKEIVYATIDPLTINYKLPAYMSINDEVTVQVTLTNNSDKEIQGQLNLILPSEIESSQKAMDVRIPAKGFINQKIIVHPKVKTKEGAITINWLSPQGNQTISKKTSIIDPNFPMSTSISGDKTQQFQVTLPPWQKGTLEAQFNIYTDVVGEVMDGVASLISKPYGCFEQTSSSTYPNVMILKYLKETGKANPEIENKALKFIDEGYKRLISFETSEGGFEWFGHTPPHETLTAFGILEFTEMKEVYNKVDQKMIDRTVAWLLNRRDGKGGFHKSKKGYDSFAGSPTDVANAYIVYALSEAGIKENYEKEYEHAKKEAIQSKDSYKIGLLACAAKNLGQIEDFKELINLLKQNISKHDIKELPVKNTITRSYGNDKQTETLAFNILALLKDTDQDTVLIVKLVEELLSNRKNGRFGATQATAMALKALIEYTKDSNKKTLENGLNIQLSINGSVYQNKIKQTANGKLMIKGLSKHLKQGENSVEILFNNKTTSLPYSLNINWMSAMPDSSQESYVKMECSLDEKTTLGNTVRLTTHVKNVKAQNLGMVTAIIGIPSGASVQPWQLKQLMEEQKIAYYEIFENYLVFYWRSFNSQEKKTIHLDLKTEISGSYQAPANCVYLYYGEELKQWTTGVQLTID